MLLNKGELDGKRVLKPETVAQMTRGQLGKEVKGAGPDGGSFGYGFGIEKKKDAVLPAGSFFWGGIFYTSFWVDPKNEVCGVLMTQLYPSQLKVREEFVRKVYAGLMK